MGSIAADEDRPLQSSGAASIRDAQGDEFDAVGKLLGDVYRVFRPYVRSPAGECQVIVAERDGRLVGTIGLYPDASRSGLERWPAGWASIRTLAVHADWRRQGIGEALARECVRRARGRGAIAIGLHTAPHMPVATRLYERVGFRRAPALDIEIGEMFTGRSLAREHSWMALAYQLDLKEI
jgi:ribosomal protein S18 acetylase RimI-like enzyme